MNLGVKLANQSSGCATRSIFVPPMITGSGRLNKRFILIDVAGGGGENLFQSRRQALSLRTAETKTKFVLKVTS